jgi:predicted  nucleic acid-binding Zn-ribbon protein
VTSGIWIGLGIFLLALLLGTVWVGYQVVKSWKQLRALSSLLDEVGKLTRSAEDNQHRLTNVEQQLADLQRQVDSLSVSMARARALANAASEVRSLVGNVRAFVPAK